MSGDPTKLRRMPERGHHDRATIDAILDEGLVCHVGIIDDGPVVIPTGYVRDGDRLLLHGSRASRLMRHLAAGQPACITVTLLDALVLARSGFNHSMDYRSVVLFGAARPLADKEAVLRTYLERLLPGRWDTLRPVTAQEVAATEVVEFPIDKASAKVRAYGVKDEPEDLEFPVWAGTIPLTLATGAPRAAAGVALEAPSALAAWRPSQRHASTSS
ncbi:MAG TPA: pyridoxamine 5'-phosphate oxidase family protein [Candidatus Thermoplasmatota archaeon]|nr:pyridoxamine 5'-phosphate oxidase family protein [Candidatus Thermoplasmatota archaeon]